MILVKLLNMKKEKHLKEIYSNVQKIYLLLLVALCGAMITPAVAKKKSKKKASTEATTKKRKRKKKPSMISCLRVRKSRRQKVSSLFISLITKFIFELPLKVLNRDILLGSTIAETTDNQFGCVGEKSGDPFLIRFVQRDSTITLRRVQAGQCSDDREIKNVCRVVQCRLSPKLFEIKAYNNDSTAVVFDMTSYLLSDTENAFSLSPLFIDEEMMGANIDKNFEKESSFLYKASKASKTISVFVPFC